MDEEKKEETPKPISEEKEPETPTPDQDTGTETEKIPAVEDAKKTVTDLKSENDRRERILDREEKLQTRKESIKALGGGSPAGDRPEKAEETAGDYTKKVMAGET